MTLNKKGTSVQTRNYRSVDTAVTPQRMFQHHIRPIPAAHCFSCISSTECHYASAHIRKCVLKGEFCYLREIFFLSTPPPSVNSKIQGCAGLFVAFQIWGERSTIYRPSGVRTFSIRRSFLPPDLGFGSVAVLVSFLPTVQRLNFPSQLICCRCCQVDR